MSARPSPWSEKRGAPRSKARGNVRLWQANLPGPFEGRLLDQSASGFRVLHQRLTIASGQEVEFQMGIARGRARVVWTRITEGEAETGFYILGE